MFQRRLLSINSQSMDSPEPTAPSNSRCCWGLLLSSLTEMISIGIVVPFIGALVNPEQVFYHPSVRVMVEFRLNQPQDLLLPITFAFCLAALAAGLLRLTLCYHYTLSSVGADFSIDVYRRTLFNPTRRNATAANN